MYVHVKRAYTRRICSTNVGEKKVFLRGARNCLDKIQIQDCKYNKTLYLNGIIILLETNRKFHLSK